MTFWEFLFLLTIKPLELIFEIIYSIANRYTANVAVSIVVLSIVVNLLVLPLYARADKIQAEASEKQKSMEKWVKHIRKTFHGEERLMMLQTYYRQNNYNPMSVILESVPLLLQVPFFIAAYNFLSNLEMLQGMPLGPIRDLSMPDALFMIGNFPVNVLPILMTLINIVSGIIYTKKQPLKLKLQIIGMALVFLVLLYNSPAGLVFYWTCNNIFSLVKNIVTVIIRKVKEKRAISGASAAMSKKMSRDNGAEVADENVHAAVNNVEAPGTVKAGNPAKVSGNKTKKGPSDEKWVFFAGAIFMIVLLGAYIPTNIIKASTQEFVEISNPQSPLHYLLYSVAYAAGTFGIWLSIFYFLARERGRRYFERGIWMVCGIAVTNYLVAGSFMGLISSSLQYSRLPEFGRKKIALSLFISALIIALMIVIAKKNIAILRAIAMAALFSILILTGVNMVKIGKDYKKLEYLSAADDLRPVIPLSKNGKNVMVIMMDRALGTEVEYIFKEKPELYEQFAGFTYYPNTVSFGAYTNFGAPALYGGYEYTPQAMNARSDEALVNKHDEALSVLPVIFDENNYEVTVCDPPYAGYYWIPDLTIYDDYPDIHAMNTVGRFDEDAPEDSISKEEIRRRNFFCHSLMKAVPLPIQQFIYDYGLYNDLRYRVSAKGDPKYTSAGYNQEFLDWYLVLKNLSDMTEVKEEGDTFLMLTNGASHEPCMLQEPDYVPARYVDNTKYHLNDEGRYTVDGRTLRMESPEQFMHFDVNTASLTELGKWFDTLRENGVYDNTRIIIVADHGRDAHHFDLITDEGVDVEYFMPLMMVKDFDDREFKIADDFMTNADTPSIAVGGLIENAKNPFTGNALNAHEKTEAPDGELTVFYSDEWNTDYNNGNVFFPGMWYTVKENPYELGNWEYKGDY